MAHRQTDAEEGKAETANDEPNRRRTALDAFAIRVHHLNADGAHPQCAGARTTLGEHEVDQRQEAANEQ